MTTPQRLAWLKSGLLWSTFFLMAFLITISMVVWVASFRIVERGPRAQQDARILDERRGQNDDVGTNFAALAVGPIFNAPCFTASIRQHARDGRRGP